MEEGQPRRETGALADRAARAACASQLVGTAPAFVDALRGLPALSAGEATVLVTGETGTGKELVARAIHYLGARAAFPFVAVNCGALPDSLLEDELFGHERGAFTDARTRRVGLIEEAHRGTVFLDEVDSLSARGQVALLRTLQERIVRPLGGSRERLVDVRFVAATNQPLAALVDRGAFRADLYYRLAVLTVALPPLRQRREDIVPLALHLLRRNLPAGRPEPALSPAAAAALAAAPWPGNVRELENAVVRALHLAAGGTIEPADLGLCAPAPPRPGDLPLSLPLASDASAASIPSPHPAAPDEPRAPRLPFQELKRQVVDAFEREYLAGCMAEHRGNVTQAARAAGKERREFGKLLKKHQMDPRSFAPQG